MQREKRTLGLRLKDVLISVLQIISAESEEEREQKLENNTILISF